MPVTVSLCKVSGCKKAAEDARRGRDGFRVGCNSGRFSGGEVAATSNFGVLGYGQGVPDTPSAALP
jgi:hypothetical protein